jgi:hypothetical protein
MIGPFFDDFLHIQKSCYLLYHNPSNRTLMNLISCSADENVYIVRVIAFLLTLISSALLFSLFIEHRTRKQKLTILLFAFTISLHPIVSFSSFYASQLSTTLTILYIYGSLKFIIEKTRPVLDFVFLPVIVLWGLMSRAESIYYLLFAYIGTGLIIQLMKHEKLLNLNLKLLLKHYTSRKLILVFALTILLSKPYTQILNGGQSSIQLFNWDEVTPFYPGISYYLVQIEALKDYIINIFHPLDASFFGPWSIWIDYERSVFEHLKSIVFLCLSLLIPSMGILQKKLKFFRVISIAFLFFLGVTIIVSSIPRLDWYSISRQMFGTHFFLGILIISIYYFSRERIRNYLIIGITFLNFLFFLGTYFNHYYSFETFARFEFDKNANTSPNAHFQMANFYLGVDKSKALNHYYQVYKMIPYNVLLKSSVATEYWLKALFNGNLVSRDLGNEESVQKSTAEILKANSIYSSIICLVSDFVPLEECLKPERMKVFCLNIKQELFSSYTKLNYRIDIKKACENYNFN